MATITISYISALQGSAMSPPQDWGPIMQKAGSVTDLHTASQGGWSCLLEEALPSISSSTQVFANAPAGTVMVRFTLRSQGATMTCDGTTAATASAHGIDLAANATYELPFTKELALKVRMVQSSATTTGWIQYYGNRT